MSAIREDARPSAIGKPEACSHNVEDGERKQIAPSEVHQLVIAEARQRAAHPDVETEKQKDFCDEPEERQKCVDEGALKRRHQVAEGAGPAAKKKQRGHAAHVDHVAVLGHEEHGEFHGAVLGVIAAGEFAFGFGQIEGRAVGFGEGGHEVDEEGERTGLRRQYST